MRQRRMTVSEVLAAPSIAEAFWSRGDSSTQERCIGQPTVQRLGVALTGYVEHLDSDRVQMVGRSEHGYLCTLAPAALATLIERLVAVNFPAWVFTCGLEPPPELAAGIARHQQALLTTRLESPAATDRLNEVLTERLTVSETVHGVLVDVYGVGMLLTGKSGIGKSEVALELISHGHRLVSDDVLHLQQVRPGVVVGHSPDLTRHHMEIRGLGIINIRDLFGSAAVRERKRVEQIIELLEWDPSEAYDRLGLDTQYLTLAGVPVAHARLPVRPGRSMRLVIEVAARNRLLQAQGTHSARAFADRLDGRLRPVPTRTDSGAEASVAGETSPSRRSDVE